MTSPKKIKVTQVKGLRGALTEHKASVRGLGLRRIRHTVELADTPETRGMIHKVRHLVQVVE